MVKPTLTLGQLPCHERNRTSFPSWSTWETDSPKWVRPICPGETYLSGWLTEAIFGSLPFEKAEVSSGRGLQSPRSEGRLGD